MDNPVFCFRMASILKASAIVGQGRGDFRTGHLGPFFVPVKKCPALADQGLGGRFSAQ